MLVLKRPNAQVPLAIATPPRIAHSLGVLFVLVAAKLAQHAHDAVIVAVGLVSVFAVVRARGLVVHELAEFVPLALLLVVEHAGTCGRGGAGGLVAGRPLRAAAAGALEGAFFKLGESGGGRGGDGAWARGVHF